MASITAVIHAYNEAHQIDRCLRSLDWVDRIFFIDTFSTDETVEIAKQFTRDIVQLKYENAAKTKNWAIDHAPAADWLFFVDADEIVSSELACEVQSAIKEPDANGFSVSIVTHIGNKPSKCPYWNPNYQVRLFRRGCARWEDREVHAKLQLEGLTRRLDSPIRHFPYPSVETLLLKLNRYTTFESRQNVKEGQTLSSWDFPLKSIARSVRHFIRLYFVKRGYRDGRMGLIVSVVSSLYVFFTDAKYWEHMHLAAYSESDPHTKSVAP